MKNVNEIRKFARRLFNDGKQVVDEGAKDLGNILSKVIGLIQPGREAVEDAKLYSSEIGASTNQDMDTSDAAVQGLLSAFGEEDRRDYDAIEKGIVAVTRKIARARKEGADEERARIKAGLIAGTISARNL